VQEELGELVAALAALPLVVGFNVKRFDYAVLRGQVDFDPAALNTCDMLEHVYNRLGYRLSLDHLAQATLGARKSADGLQALEWWKQGRLDDIVAYCTQDVAVTRDLFLFGREHGHVLFTNKAKQTVRLPVSGSGRARRGARRETGPPVQAHPAARFGFSGRQAPEGSDRVLAQQVQGVRGFSAVKSARMAP
jgi:hypothetical protein